MTNLAFGTWVLGDISSMSKLKNGLHYPTSYHLSTSTTMKTRGFGLLTKRVSSLLSLSLLIWEQRSHTSTPLLQNLSRVISTQKRTNSSYGSLHKMPSIPMTDYSGGFLLSLSLLIGASSVKEKGDHNLTSSTHALHQNFGTRFS